jgi:voltage-gated potassium channel
MDERSERWERRFEIPVLVAAVLVIPVIGIEQSDVGEPWRNVAAVLNWLIWLVFAIELVTMLAVVPDRWRWIRRHPLEVAIVVLTPPFLPASLQAARVLRLFRLLRLLVLVQLVRKLFTVEGVRYAALLAVMTALGGGAAFAAIEDRPTWDGVYWAVTTMTTVGYGDITPKTDGGRIIAMLVMVVGIGFLSLIIGAIAERFVATEVREEVAEASQEFAAAEADVLRELEEIAEHLRRVEASVRQLRRG